MSDEYYGPAFNYKVSGGPNEEKPKETKPTKPPKTKAEKRQENFKKAATIVSGLSDLAGRLKDPGLNYTPSATSVKSGASRGASYINSFDEYDTEKGGVNG